jgi:radical SAM protein with 4Fe4S-binding SPASM domain
MSNIQEHLMSRNERYNLNIQTRSFYEELKGLTVVEVCISEICTRKCGFCPRADSSIYPNRKLFMSLETIESIGKQFAAYNYNGDFHISGFGESLAHPQFFDIVKGLRSFVPNNRIALTTNGDLVNSDKVKQIYESGVDYVIVSCYDGPQAYDEYDRLFKSFGGGYEIRKLWVNPDETLEEMAKRNKFNNRSGAVSKIDFSDLKALHHNKPCYLPFYKLVIDYNGDILLCCNDWQRKHQGLGNINKNSLQDIWYSDNFKEVRNNLKEGNRNGPACSGCSILGDVIGSESVKVLGYV